MTRPACRSTAERRVLDLSWMVELSCTASCCWILLEGRPSRNSGMRTGAGPCDLNVALLCLQQYGAASVAPIRPDDARRRRLSNVSSSKRSKPWIKSTGSTRSSENAWTAVLTGIEAPEKMSRKNLAVLCDEKCLLWEPEIMVSATLANPHSTSRHCTR